MCCHKLFNALTLTLLLLLLLGSAESPSVSALDGRWDDAGGSGGRRDGTGWADDSEEEEGAAGLDAARCRECRGEGGEGSEETATPNAPDTAADVSRLGAALPSGAPLSTSSEALRARASDSDASELASEDVGGDGRDETERSRTPNAWVVTVWSDECECEDETEDGELAPEAVSESVVASASRSAME